MSSHAAPPRSGVREALLLDWRSLQSSYVGVLLFIAPVLTAVAVWFELTSMVAILVFVWSLQLAMEPWSIAKEGGARLPHLVGVSRRSVVTARYAWACLGWIGLSSTALVLMAGFGWLFGRDVADQVAEVGLFALAAVVGYAVAIPLRIRHGAAGSVAATAVVMVVVLIAVIGGAMLLVGDGDAVPMRYSLAAISLAAPLALLAVPISYRAAVRAYAAKDLS